MSEPININIRPVDHITADAIGAPGKRVFYVQGWKNEKVYTLIIEKFQLQTLAIGVEQFLGEIFQKFPSLPEASTMYEEEHMKISPPVEPIFRVGEIGLGYDAEEDLVALVCREILTEDRESDSAGVVRFWCSRSQLRALTLWGLDVVNQGRPLCPQCHAPMEPDGHFCAKKNGHKH